MGKPSRGYVRLPASEFIGCRRERGEVKHLSTRRKRKQLSDSVSSGERKRIRLNHAHVIVGRRCVCGVVGCNRSVLPDRAVSDKAMR